MLIIQTKIIFLIFLLILSYNEIHLFAIISSKKNKRCKKGELYQTIQTIFLLLTKHVNISFTIFTKKYI